MSEWGPLAALIGDWEGTGGLDSAFSHSKGEVLATPYYEKVEMKPFGPVDNGTQSLYGLNGRNFIKAILGQIHKGNKELRVVNDQVSSPTYTRYLADALLRLSALRTTGIVHVACTGGCSWFEFAQAIVKSVGADVSILPRSTAELNYPAMRPAYSVLDTTRYRECTGHAMPTWQEGLAAYLAEEPLAKLP